MKRIVPLKYYYYSKYINKFKCIGVQYGIQGDFGLFLDEYGTKYQFYLKDMNNKISKTHANKTYLN